MRWNSIYLMLKVAEQYQGAFDLLQEDDGQFVSQLSKGGGGLGPPTFDDWGIVHAFMKFLKLFYESLCAFLDHCTPHLTCFFKSFLLCMIICKVIMKMMTIF